jgi:hypothetical protein
MAGTGDAKNSKALSMPERVLQSLLMKRVGKLKG